MQGGVTTNKALLTPLLGQRAARRPKAGMSCGRRSSHGLARSCGRPAAATFLLLARRELHQFLRVQNRLPRGPGPQRRQSLDAPAIRRIAAIEFRNPQSEHRSMPSSRNLPTNKSSRAIHATSPSALSAGAGCGKTHVLTSRFLSHLDPLPRASADPTSLRQLIAITFTDAAAREMRSRIRHACYERLDDAAAFAPTITPRGNACCARSISARVSTIHAFCTALLAYARRRGRPRPRVRRAGTRRGRCPAARRARRRAPPAARRPRCRHARSRGRVRQTSQLKQRIALLVDQRHRPAFDRWLVDRPTTKRRSPTNWSPFGRLATITKNQLCGSGDRSNERRSPKCSGSWRSRLPAPANKKFTAAIATLTELLARLQSAPRQRITDADLSAIVEANARVQGVCKKDDWPTPDDFEAYKEACTKMRDAITKSQFPPWDEAAAHGSRHRRPQAPAPRRRRRGRLPGAQAAAGQARFRRPAHARPSLAGRSQQTPPSARAQSPTCNCCWSTNFKTPIRCKSISSSGICGAGFDDGPAVLRRRLQAIDLPLPRRRCRRSSSSSAAKCPIRANCHSRKLPQPAGVLHFVNALFHDRLSRIRTARSPSAQPRPMHRPSNSCGRLTPSRRGPSARQRQRRKARRRGSRGHRPPLRQLIDDSVVTKCRSSIKVTRRAAPPPARAMSRSCSARSATCGSTKKRSASTASTTTSSAATRSTPSRKSSMCSTCCAPSPARPTKSAWPACSAARSSRWPTKRCSGWSSAAAASTPACSPTQPPPNSRARSRPKSPPPPARSAACARSRTSCRSPRC